MRWEQALAFCVSLSNASNESLMKSESQQLSSRGRKQKIQ